MLQRLYTADVPRRPSGHVDDPKAVGVRVRAARKRSGLSQRALSFPGCTPAYVSRIEAGARIPSYQILREFARRLGVSAEYLARGDEGNAADADTLFEAEVALRLGDETRAREIYEQIEAEGADASSIARAQVGLGQLAGRRGEIDEAISLLEGALAGAALPPSDAAIAGNALGRAYAGQGRFEQALAIFRRFLTAARERNDRFDIIRFSLLLANAFVDSGNFASAQEVLSEVLESAQRTLDPMMRASLYWSQSRLYSSQGRSDLAAQYAQMTIATLKASEHTIEAARALLLLAHVENDRGDPETALELADEGEPVVAAAGETVDEAMFTIERARALDALGEAEEAASLLLGVIPRLATASPVSAARAYAAAANFFRSHGDWEKALELYELAADRLVTPDRHRADVLKAMAEIYEEQGRPDRALQLLKEALSAAANVVGGW